MQRILFFLTALIFLQISEGYAQDELLFESELAEAEFHVAINPVDTNNIVVSTMHGFGVDQTSYFTIYVTKDFGASWEISSFQGMHAGHEEAGDPVLAFNKDGTLFMVNLVVALNQQAIQTILSQSLDGGITWEWVYEYPNPFTDKPWIAIDNSSGPNQNNIYIPTVSTSLRLLTLNDQFELISEKAIANGEQIPSVVVGNNGDVFTSNINLSSPMSIYFQQFTDGGNTLVHSTEITTFPDYTFNAPDVSTRFQPSPYLAIDNSGGPFSGRIYLAYTASEEVDPDFFNVFLTYSDDKGVTWSTPTRVHSDDSESVQQFYSSIYVNENGVLMIDWYDRSNYDNSTLLTDFFLGISYDGGESFLERQLNTASMDFAAAIPAGFGFGIGEYHQVVATEHTVISFWSDGRSNDQDLNIFFAKVDLENPMTPILEQGVIYNDIKISAIYPQPVNQLLQVDLEIKNSADLKYAITTADGKIVLDGPSKSFIQGKHTLQIPMDIIPGSYFLTIQNNKGFFKTMHFIKQ